MLSTRLALPNYVPGDEEVKGQDFATQNSLRSPLTSSSYPARKRQARRPKSSCIKGYLYA
jgi:hypothetical protein